MVGRSAPLETGCAERRRDAQARRQIAPGARLAQARAAQLMARRGERAQHLGRGRARLELELGPDLHGALEARHRGGHRSERQVCGSGDHLEARALLGRARGQARARPQLARGFCHLAEVGAREPLLELCEARAEQLGSGRPHRAWAEPREQERRLRRLVRGSSRRLRNGRGRQAHDPSGEQRGLPAELPSSVHRISSICAPRCPAASEPWGRKLSSPLDRVAAAR